MAARKSKRKTKKRKKDVLITVIKIQSLVTAVFLIFYLVLGSVIDPSFFTRDLKEKFAWAAGASNLVSVYIVNDPPGKPSVNINALCNSRSPIVNLSWSLDPQADTYDIYRNGELLTSDLSGAEYSDGNVFENADYSYYVVAKGLGGSTQSEVMNIKTISCGVPSPPAPATRIETIDGRDIREFKCIPETDKKRPTFTGITDIPNPSLYINLVRIRRVDDGETQKAEYQTVFTATITGNENGYWSWRVPEALKRGRYILYVYIVNPDDSSLDYETSLRFNAVKKCKDNKASITCSGKSNEKKTESHPESEKESLPRMFINVLTGIIQSGQYLEVAITSNPPQAKAAINCPVLIRVIDSNGQIIYQTSASDVSGQFTIKLPETIPSGKYTMLVENQCNGVLMSSEKNIDLKETPVINFGGNISLSLSDILASLSSIILLLLGILVLFATMLLIEYLMAKQRIFEVDENSLKKRGLIS